MRVAVPAVALLLACAACSGGKKGEPRVRVLGRVSLRTTAFPPDVEIVDVVAAAGCPPPALPVGPPQR